VTRHVVEFFNVCERASARTGNPRDSAADLSGQRDWNWYWFVGSGKGETGAQLHALLRIVFGP